MATSSNITPRAPGLRGPLRLRLGVVTGSGADGAWWPRSRDLPTEAADLVDHFPRVIGRINRLIYSPPDWDTATAGRTGFRRIQAARGPVKVGSFPRDDTKLMIATLASGRRLKLLVIPSTTDRADAERQLESTVQPNAAADGDGDWSRWDDESPGPEQQ